MDTLQKIDKFITVIESLHEICDSDQQIALESIQTGFIICHEYQLLESIEEKLNYLIDSNVSDKNKADTIKSAIANAGDLKSLFLKARKLMKNSDAMQRAKIFLNDNQILTEAISGNAEDMILGLIAALGLSNITVPEVSSVQQSEQIIEEPVAVSEPTEVQVVQEQPMEEIPVQQALSESIIKQIEFINNFNQ